MKTMLRSVLAVTLAGAAFSAFATAPAATAAKASVTKSTVAVKAPATSTTSAATSSVGALSFGVATTSVQPDTLNISKASYQHFATALSKQLHTPVKLVVFANESSLMNAVNAGKVDLAYSNVVPFVNAQIAKQNIQPIATVLSWNQDKTQKTDTSSAQLVTLASNANINKLSDLSNAKVGFARESAAGFYYPSYVLQNKNIAYSYHFYNDQYDALQALKQSKVAAVALWDANFNLKQDKVQLKTIQTINNIPNPVIIASGALPANQQAAIAQAMTALPATAFTGLGFAGVENYNAHLYTIAQRAVQSVKGPAA